MTEGDNRRSLRALGRYVDRLLAYSDERYEAWVREHDPASRRAAPVEAGLVERLRQEASALDNDRVYASHAVLKETALSAVDALRDAIDALSRPSEEANNPTEVK